MKAKTTTTTNAMTGEITKYQRRAILDAKLFSKLNIRNARKRKR